MEFSRREYWSGLPFPPPEDLPNPGTKPRSHCISGRFFTIWATREAHSSFWWRPIKNQSSSKTNQHQRQSGIPAERTLSSVTQSCLTLCDTMDCSTPRLPGPHHLLKFAQVHVNCISACHLAISSSDALFSFCPHLSRCQGHCIKGQKDVCMCMSMHRGTFNFSN